MVRAWLNDDVPLREHDFHPTYGGWGVALDEDIGEYGTQFVPGPVGEVGAGVPIPTSNVWDLRLVSVRARTLASFDVAGNPTWTWTTVFTGPSLAVADVRTEIDDVAGTSIVAATVTFLYAGVIPITESATVTTPGGVLWRVLTAAQVDGRCTLQIERASGVTYGVLADIDGDYVMGISDSTTGLVP